MELPFGDEGKRRNLNGRKGKAAEPSSSSSLARTIDKPTFDVFLSFSLEDRGKEFTSHLYHALCQRGISTFIDCEKLARGGSSGRRIGELFNYVEESKIFVVVLSKMYANSKLCLMEITKIVECGRLIIPVFFHVDPNHVENQSGPFKHVFQHHEMTTREEELSRWKDALGTVGKISGYSFKSYTDGNEIELIRMVVKQISLQMELPFDDEGMRTDLNGRKRKMAEPSSKMAEPSSSLSPLRTIDKPSFDVFLSFEWMDTGKGFTSHLYHALCQSGISTFFDHDGLPWVWNEEQFRYIETSKIFVPVLSKGYADSIWCLRQITKMVECGRLIIPIFLNVHPWDVRKQMGPFETAFHKHESSEGVGEEDLRKWKDALKAVGKISGYSFQNDTNENEAELIRKVVKQISLKMELPFGDEGMKGDLNGRKGKAAEPSSSSSPASTIDKPRFDVFLSFRGEDTRKGFTSHLYNALCQRGISTFIDNEKLEKGERIEELFSYIEASKIFVTVLSKGYAHSRWCLREITKMVECGRLIIPIFFDVDPRDVRKQSGPFKLDKSSKEVGKEDLGKWKDALKTVGEISGYTFQNDSNENEAELIQNVVKQISCKLNKTARPITEHLVGMDSHIRQMYRLLDLTDNEVKMVGIVGMGGVGKTTIATAVYNKLLSDFKDYSFIKNVREHFKQYNGGVDLQKRLIKDILKEEHLDVADVEDGISLIKDKFRSKKVLVILDDADHIEQLQALAGKSDWFGSKSRIIITSRDSRVLLNHGVKEEHIYKPEHLNKENSLKLFESHAFPDVRPTESEYRELSMQFVKVTGGLPLALTVFGSLLRGRNIEQWEENLQKLKQVPNTDIDGRFRISYDGLDDNVKEIFLDISCFLIGEEKEYAIYMWKVCDLHPKTAIAELQERSLISINKDDKFEMHDLVRDMGRGIVAQEGEPWQRSRLRNLGDLLKSLAYKDKQMAKGIVIAPYYKPANDSETHFSAQDFVDFSCLRLLHLDGFAFKGEFLCLPQRLKWLRLSNCQFLNGLSGASNLNAISVLELIHVDDVALVLIEQSSSSRKAFDALKVLHLEYSLMTRTPDFTKMKMTGLRKLTLRNCDMLMTVDGSIGSLKSLVHLDLRDCNKLQRLHDSVCMLMSLETLILIRCKNLCFLPDTMCTLMSLKTLILIDCWSLSSLPEKLGDMKSLRELRAEETSIRAIPDSIGDLSNLRTLSLLKRRYSHEEFVLRDYLWRLESLEELYIWPFALYFLADPILNLINRDSVRFLGDPILNLINRDSVLCINECTGASKWLAVIPNASCEKVKELTIEDGWMQELPPCLGRLTNLEALSIHCFMLRSLPEWLGQLQKLSSFKLHCKNLRALPQWLGQLQKLKSFELECDRLDSIGEGLSLASSVEELYIRCGSIEALPATAGRTFENLRSLELNCPALKHVPNWIASLGRLEKLSLSRCDSITFLPTSMAHLMGTLCHLDLSFTQTVSDSALSFLTSSMLASGCSVRTLNLSHTNISGLPSSMSNLAQLEELHLECCENLQSLPALPSSLHVLDARGCNKLKTISDVSNLKSLRELKLSCCRLLGDFCGLESIADNLETLELPGPCGGLSGFSQLSPAFMTRVFKGAAFSSLKKFCVGASGQYGEAIPDQPFWITFPKVGRGGKRPTWVWFSFVTSSWLSEEHNRSISISILEEDGHAVYQCTTGNLYHCIGGEEIAEYSREGCYLRTQVSGPTSILNEIRRLLCHCIGGEEIAEYSREGCYLKMQVSGLLRDASLDVRYT